MSADWRLRLARPDDAGAMGQVAEAAGVPDERGEAERRRLIARRYCLLAHVGGEPAGFLLNEPTRGELHLHALLVAPAYRRRGIGRGLLRACMIDARNGGFAALRVAGSGSEADHASLCSLLGFVPVEETGDPPPGGMILRLG